METNPEVKKLSIWNKFHGSSIWKGAVFVPSSLGVVASTTPVEFHFLVKAVYSVLFKWNDFLNWTGDIISKFVPFIKIIDADVINSLIFALMLVPMARRPVPIKDKADEEMLENKVYEYIDKKGKKINVKWGGQLLLFIVYFSFVVFFTIGFITALHSELSSQYQLFMLIGGIVLIVSKAFKSDGYGKALALTIGALIGLQLLYWGNFTPWVEWVEKAVM